MISQYSLQTPELIGIGAVACCWPTSPPSSLSHLSPSSSSSFRLSSLLVSFLVSYPLIQMCICMYTGTDAFGGAQRALQRYSAVSRPEKGTLSLQSVKEPTSFSERHNVRRLAALIISSTIQLRMRPHPLPPPDGSILVRSAPPEIRFIDTQWWEPIDFLAPREKGVPETKRAMRWLQQFPLGILFLYRSVYLSRENLLVQ